MQAPRIDLFEWLIQNAPHATYNLAFSNIHGLTIQEYKTLTDFSFSDGFEFGSNAQYGADELKKVLCSMYNCTIDNIVTTTGASEANFLVFSSLLSKGDECIIEQPSYPPMWSTPEMLGAIRVNWPRRFDHRFTLHTDVMKDLITKKTKLIVLTNLHNPSGMLTGQKTIKEVARIAAEYGAYVLIDEIFLDGSFVPQPSSFGIPQVIVTSSATKIYGLGGLHTGWIVASEEVTMQCQRFKAHSTGASSFISELMTAHVLSSARNELINRFQMRAKTNLDYLRKWMDQHSEFFDWVSPDGGIVCFPRYRLKISSRDLCSYLLETQKLLVNPGIFFNQEGFLRLSYGCGPMVLQKALDALGDGMQKLKVRQ